MAPAPTAATTWILTGSPDTVAATRDRGFRPIGCEARRRDQARLIAVVPCALRAAAGAPA
jgi:hypothetical protein